MLDKLSIITWVCEGMGAWKGGQTSVSGSPDLEFFLLAGPKGVTARKKVTENEVILETNRTTKMVPES